MEEKERYEVKRLGYSLNVKLVDNNEPDWRYIIFDSVNDKELAKLETVCDWLNQQDKRIKELEEEKKVGEFWHSAYQGKQLDYDKLNNDYNKQEKLLSEVLADRSKMQLELDQLKQKLHDLPNKIVEEIEEESDFSDFGYMGKLRNGYYSISADDLDAILKKYGGENDNG